MSTVVFNVLDCPEQMVTFGELITGRAVTLTVVLAGKDAQPLTV